MEAREEMFRALLNDSMSGDFEKRMQEMMKKFGGEEFGFENMESPAIGGHDWVVDDSSKTLVIKVKQIKDHPLDIKIEKGQIKIKGDVQTVEGDQKNKIKKNFRFERILTLPDDIDQANPEFKNNENELRIKFKKLLKNDKRPLRGKKEEITI